MTVTVTGLDALAQNLDRLGTQAGQELADAVLHAGQIVQAEAQRLAPVRTGRLRDSIATTVVEQTPTRATAEVGTDVEYAAVQEFGSGRVPPHPYLRPAIDTTEDQAQRLIADTLLAVLGAV